ncbi:eukaryotic initiation factor 4A-8 [Tripterygium wilfordii]|uniref:Eukaryotic initiation factor 4A-8 n=1 Tax=Tripterygium wilfordii TaxID=458696 RepID=A0A7J7DRV3_TRIWF|nr:eukaryotic initiation factor 4A-8-like [Tripterygium wilfordii]KAF5749031.1 eukaryotic initiation factor 4A-8 [Tripterygium wilfordii]
MAGLAKDGSQFDSRMKEPLACDGQDFITSNDVVKSNNVNYFDIMELLRDTLGDRVHELASKSQQREIASFCDSLYDIQRGQSGTEKTATLCLGILRILDYGLVQCQVLVLAHTREVARQIEEVMREEKYFPVVKVRACVGGTSVRKDQCILQAGVHVVVGTPGRVLDMMRRKYLRPDYIKMFLLDEASERLLTTGYEDQVVDIYRMLPSDISVGLFSARMTPEAHLFVDDHLQ